MIQFDLRIFFKWFDSATYLEQSHDLYFFKPQLSQKKAKLPIKTAGLSKGSRYV